MAADSTDYPTEHSVNEENEESTLHNSLTDSVMDTSSSSEIQDSRKRPSGDDVEDGAPKKPHYAGDTSGTYDFKVLVPNVAAGAIIGKGGETIDRLQKDTETRVKMSKANEFYPGTLERICLITGNVHAIMEVLSFLMEKLQDLPDLNAKQAVEISADRHRQVKILVPDSTVGRIIGKAGSYIKHIEEESGSSVKISQKSKDQTLLERCITVTGDMESNRRACRMILDKVMEDPQSGTSLKVSYADRSGPVANYHPSELLYADYSRPPTDMHMPFDRPYAPIGAYGNYDFKLLVPNVAAGAIIGKRGQTIEQLEKDAEARVKMSKSNDFYPGTSDRICSITGNVYAIMSVLTFVMERMRIMLELNAKQAADVDKKAAIDRIKQIRILVPDSTVGKIIGKAGIYIKQIEEESGSTVKISPKSEDQTLQERCITVTGDMEGNRRACRMILEKVVEDSQSETSVNPSYADWPGPGANFHPGEYADYSRPQTQMHIPFNRAYAPLGAYGTYHFKLLVPNVAAGAIIGKGGETIEQLENDSEARINMSKANDFYPGTSERICLITGNVYAIMTVVMFIMERIEDMPDMNPKQTAEISADRHKQVKILVPDTTAGKIIGKGGKYIKQIEEESGSSIKISPKSKNHALQERCITVTGDMENKKTACCMILGKVVEDPQSGSCLNVSYADVSGPVADANPTGSP